MFSALELHTVSPPVNRLALVSLVLLILKVLVLNDIREPVPGMAALGTVAEAILASIVAGYAFYVMSVHLGEVKARRALAPFVGEWAQNMVRACQDQLTAVSQSSGSALTVDEATEDTLRLIFEKLNPTDISPAVTIDGRPLNWMQFFRSHRLDSKRYSDKIYLQLAHCDPVFVGHVNAIENSQLFKMLDVLPNNPIAHASMEFLVQSFTRYCHSCRELQRTVAVGGFRARAA